MAGTVRVQYRGAEACAQPSVGFGGAEAWQPGQVRDVEEGLAAVLLRGQGSPFIRAPEAPPEAAPADATQETPAETGQPEEGTA